MRRNRGPEGGRRGWPGVAKRVTGLSWRKLAPAPPAPSGEAAREDEPRNHNLVIGSASQAGMR